MSHFATVNTQIKDIEALRAAVEEMGLTLLENTEARGYGSNRIRGQYVIRLRGPYDVALNKNADGVFQLSTDWWGGHVQKEVGDDYGRLLQIYGVHIATRAARRKGYTVRRRALRDGSIRVQIQGV